MAEDIKNTTVRGLKWSFAGELLTQVARFFILIILARLIKVEDHGVFATAYILIGFGHIILEYGLPTATIQTKEVSEKAYASIFWFVSLMGAIVAMLFYLLAGLFAQFFEAQEVEGIVRWLSISRSDLGHKRSWIVEFGLSTIDLFWFKSFAFMVFRKMAPYDGF